MDSTQNGLLLWPEYRATDVAAAVAFYTEVVGWRTEPYGTDGYTMWRTAHGPLGGVARLDPHPGNGQRPSWITSVQVANVDAATKRTLELGGRITSAPADLPDIGRVAAIVDPHGAVLSLFQPSRPMPRRDPRQAGELRWGELGTPDPTASVRFYGSLFDWRVLQEMDMGPMGTYRIFGIGDRQLGGIAPVQATAGQPASWLYYFSTDDLEAAIARAARSGARLLFGPDPVPGGRIAQLLDPQGAAFALHQEARA